MFLSADKKGIGRDAGLRKVASKPKPRAVVKGKGTDEDLGTGDEELEDIDPFGMSYVKNSYPRRHTGYCFSCRYAPPQESATKCLSLERAKAE